MSELKLFPMQVTRGYGHPPAQIRESVYMAAYEVYSHVHAPQEALIKDGCRGGLGSGEIIAFLYARAFPRTEWRARTDEAFEGMQT